MHIIDNLETNHNQEDAGDYYDGDEPEDDDSQDPQGFDEADEEGEEEFAEEGEEESPQKFKGAVTKQTDLKMDSHSKVSTDCTNDENR